MRGNTPLLTIRPSWRGTLVSTGQVYLCLIPCVMLVLVRYVFLIDIPHFTF